LEPGEANNSPGTKTTSNADGVLLGGFFISFLWNGERAAANELANLLPFRARARIIERDKEQNRLKLAEYTLDSLKPYDRLLVAVYFRVGDERVSKQIREQSRALTKAAKRGNRRLHSGPLVP
jgi:hypothetical protein